MSQICELQKLIGHDLEIAKEQKDECPGKVDNTLDRQTRFLLLNGMLQNAADIFPGKWRKQRKPALIIMRSLSHLCKEGTASLRWGGGNSITNAKYGYLPNSRIGTPPFRI